MRWNPPATGLSNLWEEDTMATTATHTWEGEPTLTPPPHHHQVEHQTPPQESHQTAYHPQWCSPPAREALGRHGPHDHWKPLFKAGNLTHRGHTYTLNALPSRYLHSGHSWLLRYSSPLVNRSMWVRRVFSVSPGRVTTSPRGSAGKEDYHGRVIQHVL